MRNDIIGQPGANNEYNNANGSIAGNGGHNPFVLPLGNLRAEYLWRDIGHSAEWRDVPDSELWLT